MYSRLPIGHYQRINLEHQKKKIPRYNPPYQRRYCFYRSYYDSDLDDWGYWGCWHDWGYDGDEEYGHISSKDRDYINQLEWEDNRKHALEDKCNYSMDTRNAVRRKHLKKEKRAPRQKKQPRHRRWRVRRNRRPYHF